MVWLMAHRLLRSNPPVELHPCCLSYVTRSGGVIIVAFEVVSKPRESPDARATTFQEPESILRSTNLKTGLAGVTLLLLVSANANLASAGLSAGFSFASSHCE